MKKAMLVVLGVVVLAAIVYAQVPTPPGPGEPPMGMPRMGPMMAPSAPAMVAQGDNLYILRGDQLLKVKMTNLEVIGQTMLPRPEPPKPPPGPGQ